nr:protein kinase [Amycolatopsis umgeniensis]
MECLPSRSLSEIIEADGCLTPTAARIGAQLANALVGEDGTAKLTDLGIAHWAEVTRTGGGQVDGTPGYLAPEVADGQEAQAAADVFSLGATLFAALTGYSPCGPSEQGPTVQLRRAASGDMDPLPEAGDLTPVLATVLDALPSRRPAARMVKRLLEDITGEGAPLAPLADPRHRRGPVPTRLLLACIALVVALTAGFAIGSAWRSPVVQERAVLEQSKIGGMGDERTADPCSLIEPASLARFGDVKLDTEFGPFYNCFVRVRLSPDEADVAEVRVELRGVLDPPPPDYRRGRLGPIQRPAQANGECPRYIWMPDGHEVGVFARHRENRPTDLCGMAEAVASGVITVLAAGEIPRRPVATADSLRRLSACDLLEPADTTAVLGVAGVKPEPDFGQWTCYWEQAPLQVIVDFHRNRPRSLDRTTRRSRWAPGMPSSNPTSWPETTTSAAKSRSSTGDTVPRTRPTACGSRLPT